MAQNHLGAVSSLANRISTATAFRNYLPSGKLTQLWKTTIFNGNINYKWPFSIAMLVYQRVLSETLLRQSSSVPSRYNCPCGQATYSRALVPHKASGKKNLSGHTSYALPPRRDLPCSNLKLQVLSKEVSEPMALSSANSSRLILSRFDTNMATPNHWFSHW